MSQVRRAKWTRTNRRPRRKQHRERSSIEDESLALQSLEDIHLDKEQGKAGQEGQLR